MKSLESMGKFLVLKAPPLNNPARILHIVCDFCDLCSFVSIELVVCDHLEVSTTNLYSIYINNCIVWMEFSVGLLVWLLNTCIFNDAVCHDMTHIYADVPLIQVLVLTPSDSWIPSPCSSSLSLMGSLCFFCLFTNNNH